MPEKVKEVISWCPNRTGRKEVMGLTLNHAGLLLIWGQAELRLPSLRDRRREIDMVQTYKMVNERDSELVLKRADTRRATKAAAGRDNLLRERASHEYKNRFFTVRVTEEWNNLPDSIRRQTLQRCLSAFTGCTVRAQWRPPETVNELHHRENAPPGYDIVIRALRGPPDDHLKSNK